MSFREPEPDLNDAALQPRGAIREEFVDPGSRLNPRFLG
jgi:hypothetical protein